MTKYLKNRNNTLMMKPKKFLLPLLLLLTLTLVSAIDLSNIQIFHENATEEYYSLGIWNTTSGYQLVASTDNYPLTSDSQIHVISLLTGNLTRIIDPSAGSSVRTVFSIDSTYMNDNYYIVYIDGLNERTYSLNQSFGNSTILANNNNAISSSYKLGTNVLYTKFDSGEYDFRLYNPLLQGWIFNASEISLSGTDCYGDDTNSLWLAGYDYDNDKLYFRCSNQDDYVYIESDYYNTAQSYDSDIEEESLNNYIDENESGMYINFIIFNETMYMINKSSHGVILTNSLQDNKVGLVCDEFGNCYNQTGVCFPNNELYPGINSSNYVCTNVSVISGIVLTTSFYCYTGTGLIDGGLTYCAGGCVNEVVTNPFGIEYVNAVCTINATDCSNDCVIEGYTNSDTTTSYKQCGFYDADVCLDWSNSIPCLDGEYSLNGFCYALNTSLYDYYTLRAFSVTPNLGISSSYDEYSTPKKANYVFSESYGLIGFDYSASPTSFYISKNCEYDKTVLINDLSTRFINTSYEVLVSNYVNGDVFTRFTLPNNGSLIINGLDGADNTIYNYNVSINSSYGVCLYFNNSLVGCEAVDYVDINNIEFTVKTSTPHSTQLHSSYLKINKVNGGYQDIYTGFTLATEPNTGLKKVLYESINSSITYINIFNEDGLTEPFKNTTWTIINDGEIQYQHTCTYSSTGCRIARSYYKDDLNEGLWNYKDWEICVNGLSGSVISTSDGWGLFNRQSPTMRIILSLLITFIIMGFFIIMGVSRSENESRIMTWIGLFLSIGSLIVFTIIEWLPIWIILICALIASLGVGLFFIRKTSGGV